MHILVTNDDGVSAAGLLALVQAAQQLGEVTVIAPDRNWSASGHVKTMDRPLRVKEVLLGDGTPALASDGAPSDCVALALLGVVERKIDLVLSGINPNANIGHDVTYSGTVTAAMEAVIGGVPGIAVSLDSPRDRHAVLNYHPAANVVRSVLSSVIEKGLPLGVLLNMNIPYLLESQIKGVRLTRQGLRIYRDSLERRVDPRGNPYYWIGGESPTALAEPGSDYAALVEGFVSITPLHLDLTYYAGMDQLKWVEEIQR
jgi:5'-nucleotidase